MVALESSIQRSTAKDAGASLSGAGESTGTEVSASADASAGMEPSARLHAKSPCPEVHPVLVHDFLPRTPCPEPGRGEGKQSIRHSTRTAHPRAPAVDMPRPK